MIEQIETPHKIKNFDSVAHDAMIRRMAAQVIQNNKSSQETVNNHVSAIRKKLAQVEQIKKNYFSTSYLRDFAAKRRLIAQQINVEGC
ncbi:MAG: hypothetical protein COB83_08110 [Gammaproteobacteria bacterium]|nr:MAG: hypothetical protein COB83_08110 [Gammaproteobacteria bacterium]